MLRKRCELGADESRGEAQAKASIQAVNSLLDGIPPDLPALMKAYKLQKKAAKVGFDWDEIDAVLAKIEEELEELREAMQPQAIRNEQADELGDLLFAVVNVSRFPPC